MRKPLLPFIYAGVALILTVLMFAFVIFTNDAAEAPETPKTPSSAAQTYSIGTNQNRVPMDRDDYTISAPVSRSEAIEATLSSLGATGYTVHYGPSSLLNGHWAGTDLDTGEIFISPSTPDDKLASVAIHEYQHVLQGRLYGGYAGTVAHYGSVAAMERAADCAGYAAGMTWGNYASANACA